MSIDDLHYERLVQQYLKVLELVWQIPTFAFTVAGALVTVAFQFLAAAPMAKTTILFLTSIFVLFMAQVTLKHRLTAGVALEQLKEIEKAGLLSATLVGTDNWLEYLRPRESYKKIKGPYPEWFFRRRSELYLAFLLFLTSGAVFLLFLNELNQLTQFWPRFIDSLSALIRFLLRS